VAGLAFASQRTSTQRLTAAYSVMSAGEEHLPAAYRYTTPRRPRRRWAWRLTGRAQYLHSGLGGLQAGNAAGGSSGGTPGAQHNTGILQQRATHALAGVAGTDGGGLIYFVQLAAFPIRFVCYPQQGQLS